MGPERVRTGNLGGNQQKLDELEYFLEGIGRALFGEDGEDFRKLARFVPRTRNLSALISLARVGGQDRDPSEDLAFLFSELQLRSGRGSPAHASDFRSEVAFFRYRRYHDLIETPELLLDRVAPSQRLEVLGLLGRGVASVSPVLARLNAYAWLGVIGMPDLRAELGSEEKPSLTLEGDAAEVELGFEEILATVRGRMNDALRAYFRVAHRDLADDYRSQLARLAATTERLG